MKRFLVMVLFISMVVLGCQPSVNEQDPVTPTAEAKVEQPAAREGDVKPVEKEASGVDILREIVMTPPTQLYFKATTRMDGMELVSKYYINGENMRYEMSSPEGEYIIIYNEDEGLTYMYDPNEGVGTIMSELDDEEDDAFLDDDLFVSGSFGEELLMTYGDALLVAEITEINGYKAIYIEIEEDEFGEKIMSKQWFSIKYAIPLKIETYQNGELVMSYTVDDIDEKPALNKAMFQRPDGIEFIDLDNLFNFPQP